MSIELSTTLKSVADQIGRYDADEPLTGHHRADLYAKLSLCSELAVAMELELTGFRLLEMDRKGRSFMEAEAAKVLNTPVVSHNGKVVHPDFGRKA
ncbi:hypothetical protein ABE527_17480 [Brucella sp. TWI432]